MSKPLTRQQRLVLETDGVRFLGYDERGRPCVEAEVGIPRQRHRWALVGEPEVPEVFPEVLDAWYAGGGELCCLVHEQRDVEHFTDDSARAAP